MVSRVLLTTLIACTLGFLPTPADACSCAPPGAPCNAAWQADAVFVGQVVSIESADSARGRLVHFSVSEGFRGFHLSQVTLTTGFGHGDCGYPFRVGASYVVYAHRSPQGHLSTSICDRTRQAAHAGDDLAYLRSLASIPAGTLARIAGRVELWELRQGAGRATRMPGVTVSAAGEGRTFSARANNRGEFELTGLPVGRYELLARAPEGYASVPHTVEIQDPRGCDTTTVYIQHDGRVRGRVVDRRGAGIRGLPVELVLPADADKPGGGITRVRAWTASNGTFELPLVAPGEYILGFNSIRGLDGGLGLPRAFFGGAADPAQAARIVVSAGERVGLGDFEIPDSIRLTTVDGVVVDESGRPVRDAEIALRSNMEWPKIIGPRFITGEDGRFAFAVVDGGRYDVHVSRAVGTDPGAREIEVAIVPFTASAGTSLTVVLKPVR